MSKDEDIDIKAMVDDVFSGIPEYPGHSSKEVLGRYLVYSRIGVTAFRGESTEGFAPALDDMIAQVAKWRAARR